MANTYTVAIRLKVSAIFCANGVSVTNKELYRHIYAAPGDALHCGFVEYCATTCMARTASVLSRPPMQNSDKRRVLHAEESLESETAPEYVEAKDGGSIASEELGSHDSPDADSDDDDAESQVDDCSSDVTTDNECELEARGPRLNGSTSGGSSEYDFRPVVNRNFAIRESYNLSQRYKAQLMQVQNRLAAVEPRYYAARRDNFEALRLLQILKTELLRSVAGQLRPELLDLTGLIEVVLQPNSEDEHQRGW